MSLAKSYFCLVRKFLTWLAIFPIRFYQAVISPLLGANCRHEPTCSNYSIEAIRVWGPIKGIWLGMKRIAKCHPWGTSGYDPVPSKDDKHKKA